MEEENKLFKNILELYIQGKPLDVIAKQLNSTVDIIKDVIDGSVDMINQHIRSKLPVFYHTYLTDNCLTNIQFLLTYDESLKYNDYMLDLEMRKALVNLLQQAYTDDIPNPSKASVAVALINNIFKKGTDV